MDVTQLQVLRSASHITETLKCEAWFVTAVAFLLGINEDTKSQMGLQVSIVEKVRHHRPGKITVKTENFGHAYILLPTCD